MYRTLFIVTRWRSFNLRSKARVTESRLSLSTLAVSQCRWSDHHHVRTRNTSVYVLRLTSSDLIKYFGFELGAQTNIDPSDDRWIVNGAHEASKLQDYLDGFISRFVLCKKCKNPETEVKIRDGNIVLDCKACGERSNVDARLKLSSFILKHDPKKSKKDKSTKKAERKAKKEKERAAGNGGDGNNSDGSPDGSDKGSDLQEDNGEVELDAGSDDEFTRRINAEAQDLDQPVNEKDIQWSVDTSEEAVRARAKQLPDDLKRSLTVNGDEDEDVDGEDNPYDQLGVWLESTAAEKGGVVKIDDVEIYKKAQELGIEKRHKTLTVLAQAVFDENIVKQIDGRAPMLKKVKILLTSECNLLIFIDDHLRKTREGSPWRHRTLRRHQPPQPSRICPEYPNEVL